MKKANCAGVLGMALLCGNLAAGDFAAVLGKDDSGEKIVPTNSITIGTNEVLTLQSLATFGSVGLGSPLAAYMFGYIYTKDTFRITNNLSSPLSFAGPAELRLILNMPDSGGVPSFAALANNSGAHIYLKSSLQNFPPDKTLVIPAGSPGANISLEASSDLVFWWPAPLGTYTTPTNHLFFRLKLDRLQ